MLKAVYTFLMKTVLNILLDKIRNNLQNLVNTDSELIDVIEETDLNSMLV